ncbi:hypothetical protein F5888DRAFT_1791032 [Russula emetica]|nr:hypothetical protein F5888DRAFT_1791032 [Russula emetica]
MPSSNQQPTRLTKKQKKATAFRERGSGSGKSKGKGLKAGHSRPLTTTTTGDKGENGYDDDDEDANAIPAMEDQDQALVALAGYMEGGDAKGDDSAQSRRAISRVQKKTAMESTSTSTAARNNKSKRKRGSSRAEELGGDSEEAEAQPGPKKKAKLARSSEEILSAREDDGVTSMNDDDDSGDGDGSKTKSKGSSKPLRYILFIGNLKYTTTREAIQKHFALCDPPPTVRLLTPKVTRATAAAKSKSKGCAFLEFSMRHALQAALRLHQSELDGRRINVELTAGGGGKSDARLAKVKARNKHLGEQRPQRFSTTSGEGEVPHTKRTWTVGDGDQGGERHGKTKAGKKRGTRTKNWGTGVNALPIG